MFSEDHPLSPSWALLHTHNLPPESATVAAMRGGEEFRGWGPDRYMVARMIDQLSALRYILLLANRDPKKQPPKPPEMYPLPDHKTKQSKQARDAQPGSFASIANGLLAKGKKRKEGGG